MCLGEIEGYGMTGVDFVDTIGNEQSTLVVAAAAQRNSDISWIRKPFQEAKGDVVKVTRSACTSLFAFVLLLLL